MYFIVHAAFVRIKLMMMMMKAYHSAVELYHYYASALIKIRFGLALRSLYATSGR